MSRSALIILVVLLLELFLLLFIVSPSWSSKVYKLDTTSYASVFGQNFASKHMKYANNRYHHWFVASGVVKGSYDTFIATEEQRKRSRGMEDLGTGMQAWMYKRITAFWTVVKTLMFRASALLELFLYSLLLYIPFVIDGLVQRTIDHHGYVYASPTYFHAAKNSIQFLLLMPLAFLLVPMHVHPVFILSWLGVFPIALWLGAKNVQHVI